MTYLRGGEFGAHFTYAVNVRIGFACLQELGGLDDGVQTQLSPTILHLGVTQPLLQVGEVVPVKSEVSRGHRSSLF